MSQDPPTDPASHPSGDLPTQEGADALDPRPRYVVRALLGRGGMGSVYLAFDRVRGEDVALKRIHSRERAWVIAFKREFRLVEQLTHPGLARMIELGEDAEGLFFTMEVVPGLDLQEAYREPERFAPPTSSADAQGARDELTQTRADGVETTATESLRTMPAVARAAVIPAGDDAPRPRVVWDLPRLRAVILPLIAALKHLHAAGIVHRDLKASNVRVRPDGVVKLLDFGIAIEARPGPDAEGPGAAGTPAFMAPEQIRGEPATAATDVYALGCLLYVIVSGRLPFEGSAMDVLRMHVDAPPPSLRDAVPDLAPTLDAVWRAMLAKRPEDRPTLDAVARALDPDVPSIVVPAGTPEPPRRTTLSTAPPPSRPPSTSDLVGRGDLEAILADHLEAVRRGASVALLLTGPSGAGKTSLANRVGDVARGLGMRVLRGRARLRERVAFNALDAVIDGLALDAPRAVPHGDDDEDASADARQRRLASRAFPVLRADSDAEPPPSVPRAVVFNAVAGLLAAVARERSGLVILVDDLQWADDDSVGLLAYLLEQRIPRLLVLASARDDADVGPAASLLTRSSTFLRIEVPPLDAESTAEIVRRAVADRGGIIDDAAVARIVAVCHGRPYLAEVLGAARAAEASFVVDVDASPESAADVLARTVARLSPAASDMLVLLHAAEGHLAEGALARITGTSVGEIDAQLAALAASGLVRRLAPTSSHGRVELYHDAVHRAVEGLAGAAEIRRAHLRLAEHIERELGASSSSAPRLVQHWLGAGEPARAASLARTSALEAEGKRAFGLAAAMHGVAAEHGPEALREASREAEAEALERSGQYAKAARTWRVLVESGSPSKRDERRLREAIALLGANEISLGRQRVDEALTALGEARLGRGRVAALFSALAFRIGPRGEHETRAPALLPPASRADADADGSATLSPADEGAVRLAFLVSYFDPLAGLRLLRRSRAAFEARNAHGAAAVCDYYFSYLAMFAEPRGGPVDLALRYRRSAEARLRGAPRRTTILEALPLLLDAVAAQREGRWDEGARAGDVALDAYARAGLEGTNEHVLALIHRFQLDAGGQSLARMSASLTRLRAVVRGVGDTATYCHVLGAEATYWHFLGDFARVRAIGLELEASWRGTTLWTFQRAIFQLFFAGADLTTGDPRDVRRRVEASLPRMREHRAFDTMYGGVFATTVALTEACALRVGDRDASARRVRTYARIAARAPVFTGTTARRALAYLADVEGRPADAVVLLDEADRVALAWGQPIDAAIARHQRGLRLGGDEGARLRAEAAALMAAAGASPKLLGEDPAR